VPCVALQSQALYCEYVHWVHAVARAVLVTGAAVLVVGAVEVHEGIG